MITFEEVIGQNETQQRLIRMCEESRIPHAIMLHGSAGVGKMALAIGLAKYLLGNSPLLRHGNHPDLHFTFPTIKLPSTGSDHKPVSDDFIKEWLEMMAHGPYFTIEQWMKRMGAANQQAVITAEEADALSHKLSLKASQGGYKVSMIWLPERMTIACANKMLKLLEEPPFKTVFILVSESPELLPETIISRTQRIHVHPIKESDIRQALISRRGIQSDKAQRIAHSATGNWNKATDMLDADSENNEFLGLYSSLMRLAYKRRLKELKEWSEKIAASGRERQKRLLTYFARLMRENFVYNFRCPELNYMSEEEEAFAAKFAPYINEANITEMAEMTDRAYRDISQNANSKIVFFDYALRTIILINKAAQVNAQKQTLTHNQYTGNRGAR